MKKWEKKLMNRLDESYDRMKKTSIKLDMMKSGEDINKIKK